MSFFQKKIVVSSFTLYRERQFFTSSLNTSRTSSSVHSNNKSKNQSFFTQSEEFIRQTHNSNFVLSLKDTEKQERSVQQEESTSWFSNSFNSFSNSEQQSFIIQTKSDKSVKMRKSHLNYFIENKSARRWLQEVKKTLDDDLDSNEWIVEIESKLKNEIESWTEESFEIQQMIKKKANAIIANKNTFVTMLLNRFSERKVKQETRKNWLDKLKVIQQKKNENLNDYYERTINLLRATKEVDDRDDIIMNVIIERFVAELHDSALRRKIKTRYVNVTKNFQILKSVYETIEKQFAILKSKKKNRLKQLKVNNDKKLMNLRNVINFWKSNMHHQSDEIKNIQIRLIKLELDLSNFVVVFRFARQSHRIVNKNRIQNVINTKSTSTLQQYFEYSSQDSREQQQSVILVAVINEAIQSREQRMFESSLIIRQQQKNQAFWLVRWNHYNRIINDTLEYNRDKHDKCCIRCDETRHILRECTMKKLYRLEYSVARLLKWLIDMKISVTFEKVAQTKLKRSTDLFASSTSFAQIAAATNISFDTQQFAINAMYYTYDTEACNENDNHQISAIEYDEMYNSNNFVSKMKKSASKLIQLKIFDSKNEQSDVNEIISQRFLAINFITISTNSKYDSKSEANQSTKMYIIETQKKKRRMKYDDDAFDVKKKFAAK